MVGKTSSRWLDLGPTFVRRVLVTTVWLGVLVSVLLSFYAGRAPAAAFAVGAAIGACGLFLLERLVREIFGGGRKSRLALLLAAKFGLLYAAGAWALIGLDLKPLPFLFGFSLFLLVASLKVAGRLVLSTRWMQTRRDGPGGPFLRQGPGSRGSGR